MERRIKVYNLVLTDDETGITATSLVADPAHEVDFVAFAKEVEKIEFAADVEKRNVTGPLLVPNKLIYRRNAKLGEHYVYFTREDIEKIATKHGKDMRFSTVTNEHTPSLVKGAYMVESWITGSNDKAKELGFDVPVGTWMSTMHIENDELWKQIKSGERRGFSIEGLFSYADADIDVIQNSKETPIEEDHQAFIAKLTDESIPEQERIDFLKSFILNDKK